MTQIEVEVDMERVRDMLPDSKSAILFVDDEEDFAKVFIPKWEKKSGFRFLYARDAKTAKEYVEQYPIKVAVLDQIMPTPGTELRKQLLAIEPKLKTVLLSGELREYMVKAPREGFDYAMLKKEEDLENLPHIILALVAEYNSELKAKPCEVMEDFYTIEKGGWLPFQRQRITYSIIDYTTVEAERVTENWHTRVKVEAGQELTSEESVDFERDFQFKNDFKIENHAELSLSETILSEFKSSLAAKMEAAFEANYTEKVKKVFKRTNKYGLPTDSSDIISRSYEYAKMAKVLRIYVKRTCSCCNGVEIIPMTVLLPIPVIKYRIVDHHKDNTTTITDAGEIR